MGFGRYAVQRMKVSRPVISIVRQTREVARQGQKTVVKATGKADPQAKRKAERNLRWGRRARLLAARPLLGLPCYSLALALPMDGRSRD